MRYKEWRKRQNERPESAPPPSAAPNDPWWTRAGDPRPGDPWWLRYGQSRDRDGRYGRRGRRCNLNLAQFLPAARPKLFFAVFLVCAGAVLFLDNIGLLAVHDVWAYWPLIFVAMGISRAANISCGLSRFWGGLLVLGGIGLVLNNLGLLYIRGDLFWPLLLIVFGAMTLLKTVDQHRQQTARFADAGNETSKAQPDSLDHNSLREWVVFGNTKRRIDSRDFRGGEMLSLFGEINIDLRGAQIAMRKA
ncbi:MAG: LiaI-LiaF-like domain-containing protein, partial [Bryobacteraceae bacterium]